MATDADAVRIWTVGHSTLPIEDFLALLAAHRIVAVADVRRFPMSRRHPQYNRDPLHRALAQAGLRYLAFPDLGGRREPRADSTNTAWRNASFRGYADYMDTPAFGAAADRLAAAASAQHTAVMCAEALWWRCHRGLIADYLQTRGLTVLHIMPTGEGVAHPLTSAARLIDGHLSYAGDPTLGL